MTNGTEYGGHGPLLKLISQYPILTTLASQIPTLDLLNLGLTSMIYYDYILASSSGWTKLKSICLCDGQGLRDRQDLKGLYRLTSWQYIWGHSRKIHEDEEIEVKLYNLRCRDDDTLPCCKCGINVCEECRYYPRAPPRYPYAVRRPHLTAARELQNIMLLCESCDEKVEKEVNGKFLNHLCDCDVFTRWICIKCRIDERNEAHDYFVMFTKTDDQLEREYEAEDGLEQAETKWVGDHQCSRYFWCTCNATVPDHMVPRCTWCRRRHIPEEGWRDEWLRIGSHMPYFENDPCYPDYVVDGEGEYPTSYPKLQYSSLVQQR